MTGAAVTKPEEGRKPLFSAPRLRSETLEGLKWFAMILMIADHTNRLVFDAAWPAVEAFGRLSMPLFGFVLAYHLARTDALARGVHRRVIGRLVVFGLLATVPYSALATLWPLNGLLLLFMEPRAVAQIPPIPFWPINALFMLAVATLCIRCLDSSKWAVRALAFPVFILGGALVEFWWFGVGFCICAWWFCRNPGWLSALAWVVCTASLALANQSHYALLALPLIAFAGRLPLAAPRLKYVCYAMYPAHLLVLWAVKSIVAEW
jgi:hypothetical protein